MYGSQYTPEESYILKRALVAALTELGKPIEFTATTTRSFNRSEVFSFFRYLEKEYPTAYAEITKGLKPETLSTYLTDEEAKALGSHKGMRTSRAIWKILKQNGYDITCGSYSATKLDRFFNAIRQTRRIRGFTAEIATEHPFNYHDPDTYDLVRVGDMYFQFCKEIDI